MLSVGVGLLCTEDTILVLEWSAIEFPYHTILMWPFLELCYSVYFQKKKNVMSR